MESRDRILDAAARVYAEAGFRGATTRRIAEQAGVNEITIFRQFGSKAALIDEVLRSRSGMSAPAFPPLPEVPRDPEGELTAWCSAHLERLRAARALIRKSMSELEERPAAGPCVTAPTAGAARELKRYMQRMHDAGLVDWRECGPQTRIASASGTRSEIAHAAGAMLMAALFADAMGRDFMPDMYPQPAERAPALYVRLFLCAIGARVAAARRGGGTRKAVSPPRVNGHARPAAPPPPSSPQPRASKPRTSSKTPRRSSPSSPKQR